MNDAKIIRQKHILRMHSQGKLKIYTAAKC